MKYLNKYPRIAVFILGALSNLALAPFEVLPILLLTFPLFFKVLNEQESVRPFWLGWWFGFGYFLFGLYWISNSLLVDAERFAWMIPFAISLIPAVLSVYIGLVCWGYFKLKDKASGSWQIFLFAALWMLAEIARNYLFTGFPWNLIGYASLGFLPMAQFASIVTVFGMSFIVVIFALLPVLWQWKKAFYISSLILLNICLYGAMPVLFGSQDEGSGKSLKMRIVQPNIEQSLRWDPSKVEANFQKTLDLAGQESEGEFDVIILPEAAVPYHINRDDRVREMLAKVAPEGGFVVTGGLRSEGYYSASNYKVWNSLYVLDGGGQITAKYDKHHLVPFGEYVPLRDVLPIDKITPGAVNFSSGRVVDSVRLNSSLSFNPLICYEIIFPQYVSSSSSSDFILNITNDGWFGDSTGPYQHLAMARMRAIESEKMVVRAANTGVSAVISPLGEIIGELGLGETGVLDLTYNFN